MKYAFAALGVLLFFMLIGASFFFADASDAAALFSKEAGEVITGIEIHPNAFVASLAEQILTLDWAKPLSAVRQIAGKAWLSAAVTDGLKAAVPDYEAHAEALATVVGKAGEEVASAAVRFILWSAAGAVAGFFLTHALVRREIAPRKDLKTSLFAVLFGSILPLAVMSLTLWLTDLCRLSSVLAATIFLLVSGLTLLFSAYLVQGAGKVRPKEIVCAKNLWGLLACAAVVFAAIVLFTVILSRLCGGFFGTIAFYALFTVGFFTSQMHAESYVKSVADARGAKRK